MSEKSLPVRASGKSAFAVTERRPGVHIIDELIEERCPSFAGHWTWPLLRHPLLGLLGYGKAVKMADRLAKMSGAASFDYLADALDFRLEVENLERLPATGAVVVVANHPTGLADGAAVWKTLSARRRDVMFFANADALRVNPGFADALIPVEWVLDKRSPAKTRETLKLAGEAFEQGKCIVIFPSGKLAKMIDGELTEQEWHSTAIGLARKKKAPIVPLHVRARNSRFYYSLARLNGELRDITLFHELLNKKGARFGMEFGPLIPHEHLAGDALAITARMRDYVSYELGDDPDLAFDGENTE